MSTEFKKLAVTVEKGVKWRGHGVRLVEQAAKAKSRM